MLVQKKLCWTEFTVKTHSPQACSFLKHLKTVLIFKFVFIAYIQLFWTLRRTERWRERLFLFSPGMQAANQPSHQTLSPAWLPRKRNPSMTKASTQACRWNPKTFPKIFQPWQSNCLSISSNPPHQQPKLSEFRCEIIVIRNSQRNNNKSEKHRMRAKSKLCLNTKEFVQAKLQTTQEMVGKKQRSLGFPAL